MRLGLALDLGSAAPVADQVEAALPLLRVAESSGLTDVWVGESYHRRPEAFHLPASLVVLAHLAALTPLGLGTGVLLLRAHDPRWLAYEAALVDQLSRGRLSLGLGLGAAALDARSGPGRRTGAEVVESALRELRRAWGRDGTPADVAPRPVHDGGPRLLVGGGAPVSARRAAELGDGYYAATNYDDALLGQQAAAYRANGGAGEVVANRLCLVHPDGDEARALAGRHLRPAVDYYTERGLWRSTADRPTPEPAVLVGSPPRWPGSWRRTPRSAWTR